MVNKNLSLKLAALLLACGGFGVVSNFAASTSVYAMERVRNNENKKQLTVSEIMDLLDSDYSQENYKEIAQSLMSDVVLDDIMKTISRDCNQKYDRKMMKLMMIDGIYQSGMNSILHNYPFPERRNKKAKLPAGFKIPIVGCRDISFSHYVDNSPRLYVFIRKILRNCNFDLILNEFHDIVCLFSEIFKHVDKLENKEMLNEPIKTTAEKNKEQKASRGVPEHLSIEKYSKLLRDSIQRFLFFIQDFFVKAQETYNEVLAKSLMSLGDLKILEKAAERCSIVTRACLDKIHYCLKNIIEPSLYDLITDSRKLEKVAPERKGLFKKLVGEEFAKSCANEIERIVNTHVTGLTALKRNVGKVNGGGLFCLEEQKKGNASGSDSEGSVVDKEILNKKRGRSSNYDNYFAEYNAHLNEKNKTVAKPNPVLAAPTNVVNNNVGVEPSANSLPANINDASYEQLQRFRLFLANEYKFNFICDPNNINSLKEAVQPYYNEYASKYNEYLLKNKNGAQPNPVLAAPINVVNNNNNVGVEPSAENVAGNLDNGNKLKNKPKKEIEFITKKRKKTDN